MLDTLAARTPHEPIRNALASFLGLGVAVLALLVVRGLTDRQENTVLQLSRAN